MSTWVAGVDGCRSGFVAAFARTDRAEAPRLRTFACVEDVVDAPQRPAVVAVDMPLGLPEQIEGPGRLPEQQVRGLLGGRQSSVFSIPARSAVFAETYDEACRIAAAASSPSRKVSRQGFMLFPKIRELDLLLRSRPELAERIYEVHPEVAFWSMNGEQPLDEPKKVKGRPYGPGLALRRSLLLRAGLPEDLVGSEAPPGAAQDDVLDALAGLVVALKIAQGQGRSFPESPERDAHGLPVAIWTFRT
jgi:threonine dehydratase